jgi:hypothetical protein
VTFLAALRRLPKLETAILVIAVAVLVALAVATGKQQQVGPTIDSFSSYDPASGGYRAFYQMLGQVGVHVDRFERRPAFLDAEIDTLIYVEPYDFDARAVPLSASDLAALEAWVRAGGHLLYIGHDNEAAKHGVLSLPITTDAAARTHAAVLAPELERAGVTHVTFETAYRWKRWNHDFSVLVDDGRGPLAVTYPFGRGRVTALIDEAIFRNDEIGRPDRARFAYALAAPSHPNGVVSFDETPHGHIVATRWWDVVPRSFAIAIFVAIGVILVALAGAAIRFGPPLVPVERRDRTSADFIDAFSTLLERGGARRKASRDAARSTSRAIARSVGASADASSDAIASAIDRDDFRADYRNMLDVTANGFADDRNLVLGVALAQRLRKEFATHGRPGN